MSDYKVGLIKDTIIYEHKTLSVRVLGYLYFQSHNCIVIMEGVGNLVN